MKERLCKNCGKPTIGGILDDVGIYCWNKECVAAYDKKEAETDRLEIEKFKLEHKCIFVSAWADRCGKTVVKGSHFCPDHLPAYCVECGKKAIRQCNIAGVLVCGRNLCDDCDCSGYHG